MFGLAETFAVAAALKIKAPSMAIALLGSLPGFAASLLQIVLPLITNPAKSRKHYVLGSILFQAFFLSCAGMTGFMPQGWGTAAFIVCWVLYSFSGQSMSTLWMAWMGDLIPESVRGRHFAWRNRFFAMLQLSISLITGLVARKYTADTAPWLFFMIIFTIAGISRVGSYLCMRQQYEPPEKLQRATRVSFNLSRRFLAFAFTTAIFQGAAAFSGPFFNVYFLRDLKLDYLNFTVIGVFGTIGTLVGLPLWGRLNDSIGTRKVFQITAFLAAFIPIPYLFCQSVWALWLCNFYSGICWSGFNISNFSYLLHLSGREKTERAISISVAITGISNFCFSLMGGYAASRVPVLFAWQLQTLFLLSSLMRFGAIGIFSVLVKFGARYKGGSPTQRLERIVIGDR